MADTQIIIDATDTTGKTVNKTIKNINPAATNAQLATFGVMLNALTDNQYGETTKITKVHCDVEPGGGTPIDTRAVPTLLIAENARNPSPITETSVRTSADITYGGSYVHYTGDGQIMFGVNKLNSYAYIDSDDQASVYNSYGLTFKLAPNTPAGTDVIFNIETTETENFKAASMTFTIHVTA